MKKSILISVALAMVAAGAVAADTYVVDKVHSEATFRIHHLVGIVSGRFDDFSGTITLDQNNPEASSVQFAIKAASINTGVTARDNDLRSANFFEVDKYPEITFKSTSIKPAGTKDTYDVTGALTMHGVTRTITLPVTFGGIIKDPWGNQRAGFSLSTVLNRKDYGINWNKTLDNGGVMLADNVNIDVSVEAVKQAAAAAASK